jgi:nicotinamidase-related amidase
MRPALLVIDVQKAFFERDPITTQLLERAVEYINAAIELFREKGLPVISVQHQDEEGDLMPGSPGFEMHESVNFLPSDLRIVKTYGNSFNKTDLAEELRALGVDTVIVTGFCAEYCILSTCRGAQDHDFTPIIFRGSLASGVPERIRFVEDVNDVISYGALKAVLAK